MSLLKSFGLGLCLLVLVGPAARGQAELRLIGAPGSPGTGFFGTFGVSSPSEDGRIVGGDLPSPLGIEPVIWTREQGIQKLPLIPGLQQITAGVRALSPHGEFAAGKYQGTDGSGQFLQLGVRWEDGQERETFANSMPVANAFQGPRAISLSGDVVIGTVAASSPSSEQLFRWTETSGFEVFVDSAYSRAAWDVSEDGQTIVGQSTRLAEGQSRAFLWTEGSGFQTLVDSAPALVEDSRALRWVEGRALGMVGAKPFVWSDQGVEIVDSTLPGLVFGMGGQFAGGTPNLTALISLSQGGNGDHGAIWTSDRGVQSVASFLADLGLSNEVAGWTNVYGRSISKNGQHIVGAATDALGRPVDWIVSVPEPSTFALSCVGLSAVALLRAGAVRRRRSLSEQR